MRAVARQLQYRSISLTLSSSFPAIFAVAACTCSALFTFFCESVQVESTDASLPTVEFGLYTTKRYYIQEFPDNNYKVKAGCFYFDEDYPFDSKWKTARAFGVLTVVLGGLAIIASIFGPFCYPISESMWKAMAGLYMVILPLFQGLTFLMLRSELCSENSQIFDFMEGDYGGCQWNGGSTANVCGVILWFLAGAAMLFAGAPVRETSNKPAETQEVTYEQRENGGVNEVDVVKGNAVADSSEEQPSY